MASTSVSIRRAAGVVAVLGVLTCALAAVVALGPPAAAANHAVMIEQYAYSPAGLTVAQGDTVTWTNHDSVQHDVMVTSGPATFHSPMLSQGQSWSHAFTVAGSYAYVCSVHPDMRASVVVRPTPSASPKPSKAHTASTPAAAAPATRTPTATKPASRTAARQSPAAAATQAAAPTMAQEIPTPATSSASTLDPLLLVAGVSTAVTVFCLLLMTSRPVVKPAEPVAGDG